MPPKKSVDSSPEMTRPCVDGCMICTDGYTECEVVAGICHVLKVRDDVTYGRLEYLVNQFRNEHAQARSSMRQIFEGQGTIVVGHHWCHVYPVQLFARCVLISEENHCPLSDQELYSFKKILNGRSNCYFGPVSCNLADTIVEKLWVKVNCGAPDELGETHKFDLLSSESRSAICSSAKNKIKMLEILKKELNYRIMFNVATEFLKDIWYASIVSYSTFLEELVENNRCKLNNPEKKGEDDTVENPNHRILVCLPPKIDELLWVENRIIVEERTWDRFFNLNGITRGDRWTIASRCLWCAEAELEKIRELRVVLSDKLSKTKTWTAAGERKWRVSMLDSCFESKILKSEFKISRLKMEIDDLTITGFDLLDSWGIVFQCLTELEKDDKKSRELGKELLVDGFTPRKV